MLGEREEAADVAQETFARLCESGAVHEEPAARVRWVWRTSTRLAIDLLRRRRLGVETRAEAPETEAPGGAVDAVVAARRQLAAIASAAPRRELEVAMLCRVDGLTQPEAAEVAGVSERTVRRLLDRFDGRVARLGGRAP